MLLVSPQNVIMSKIRSFDEKYVKKFLIREGAENLLALRMQKITVEDHMSRLYGPTVVAHETMNQVGLGCRDQSRPFGDCLFLSALLHRPRKAAGYTVPTATAPLRGLLHCLPCVARLKEANNHQMADPARKGRLRLRRYRS